MWSIDDEKGACVSRFLCSRPTWPGRGSVCIFRGGGAGAAGFFARFPHPHPGRRYFSSGWSRKTVLRVCLTLHRSPPRRCTLCLLLTFTQRNHLASLPFIMGIFEIARTGVGRLKRNGNDRRRPHRRPNEIRSDERKSHPILTFAKFNRCQRDSFAGGVTQGATFGPFL